MYYAGIQDIDSGFTIQVFSLIRSIIDAYLRKEKVVVIDKFRNNICKIECTAVSNIFNIEDMNIFLKNEYDIIIVDKYNVHFEILSIMYGTCESDYIEITSFILNKYFKDNKLIINKDCCFNEIKGDPCVGKYKSVILKYKINGYKIKEVYEENLKNDIVIDFDTDYPHKLGWINNYNDNMFDKILTNIKYNEQFMINCETVINNLKSTIKINVIHLRLEDDAISHWSQINNISKTEYKNILENKYIKLVNDYISKDDQTIILSGSISNGVIDYLNKNNYNYETIYKFYKDREKNAIVELLVSTYCNNIFIGNFNMKKLSGSTFSYYVGKLIEDNVNSIIYIDLDRIFDNEEVHNSEEKGLTAKIIRSIPDMIF